MTPADPLSTGHRGSVLTSPVVSGVRSQARAPVTYEIALQRVRALADGDARRILGIVGMPGSGKSTLANRVIEALGPKAVNVPMDGFHLANAELAALGR